LYAGHWNGFVIQSVDRTGVGMPAQTNAWDRRIFFLQTYTSPTISFTLINTSGSWSSAGQVLKANAKGYFAAAHIFVTASPAKAHNGCARYRFLLPVALESQMAAPP